MSEPGLERAQDAQASISPAFSALPQEPSGAAEGADRPAGRRPWLELAEGVGGWFLLLLLAAAGGALLVLYWPWMNGGGAEETAMTDRVTALERQVGQLAAGRAPQVAATSFAAIQDQLKQIKTRLDADEARLTAVERGGTGSVDVEALKQSVDKNSSAIAQLAQGPARAPVTGNGVPSPQTMQGLASAQRAIGDDQRSIAALQGQMRTVSAMLSQLEGRMSNVTNGLPQQLAALNQRVSALEKAAPPADLDQRLGAFALKSGVSMLEQRVGRIEAEDVSGMMKKAAAMLALADLARATMRDAPYDDELSALEPLVPDWPEMTVLEQYSTAGVPTVPQLAQSFHPLADAIVAAERIGRAKTWIGRLWARLTGLVSVREVGDVAGTSTEARVARAEFDLDRGLLALAVKDLDGLDAPAKAAATSWLDAAQSRLMVDQATRKLTQQIVASLTEEHGSKAQHSKTGPRR